MKEIEGGHGSLSVGLAGSVTAKVDSAVLTHPSVEEFYPSGP